MWVSDSGHASGFAALTVPSNTYHNNANALFVYNVFGVWMAVWIRAKMAQLLAEAKLRPWGSTAER